MHHLRIALACIALAGLVHTANAQTVRPNVVILLTDDQGTMDANCYGFTDLIAPNMDKLAATGVCFTQSYGPSVFYPVRCAAHRPSPTARRYHELDAGRPSWQ